MWAEVVFMAMVCGFEYGLEPSSGISVGVVRGENGEEAGFVVGVCAVCAPREAVAECIVCALWSLRTAHTHGRWALVRRWPGALI